MIKTPTQQIPPPFAQHFRSPWTLSGWTLEGATLQRVRIYHYQTSGQAAVELNMDSSRGAGIWLLSWPFLQGVCLFRQPKEEERTHNYFDWVDLRGNFIWLLIVLLSLPFFTSPPPFFVCWMYKTGEVLHRPVWVSAYLCFHSHWLYISIDNYTGQTKEKRDNEII